MDNKEIAKERIEVLFKEADKTFSKNKVLANSYIQKARKIAMKFKVRIDKKYKRKFCKHCNSYLRPGVNLRVRNNKSTIVYYCLECKKFMRFRI